MVNTVGIYLTGIVLLISSIEDIRNGRINPYLAIIAIGLGIIVQAFNMQEIGPVGYLLRFLCLYILFLTYDKLMGGADAKMLMMIIIWCGIKPALLTLGIGSIYFLCFYAVKSPSEVSQALKNAFYSLLRAKITKLNFKVDGNDKKHAFIPFLCAGYITTVICQNIQCVRDAIPLFK